MRVYPDIYERYASKIKVDHVTECWMWQAGIDKDGYGNMWVRGDARRVHRLSWELHVGPIPAGMFVCHKCDRPGCSNPQHLFLGTPADNMRDRDAKGRHRFKSPKLRGTMHGMSVLTEDIVRQIRSSSSSGAAMSRLFNVSQSTIASVRKRHTWSHVT